MADAPAPDSSSGLNILKQKVGGLPVWIYMAALAAGGVGVAWWTSRNKTTSASANSSTPGVAGAQAASASSLYPVAPVTYVTGVQQPTSDTSSTSTSSSTIQVGPAPGLPNTGVYSQSVAAFSNPNEQGSATLLPFGTYTLAGQPTNGNYPVNVNGQTLWVLGENVSAVNGGGGGLGGLAGFHGSSVRYGGLGGLSTPWQQMHQQHRQMGYWSGLGGKGGSLQAASKATGMSMERLQSLNPFHDGGLVRIA